MAFFDLVSLTPNLLRDTYSGATFAQNFFQKIVFEKFALDREARYE